MVDNKDSNKNLILKVGFALVLAIVAVSLWVSIHEYDADVDQPEANPVAKSDSALLNIPSGQGFTIKTNPDVGITNQDQAKINGRVSDPQASIMINGRPVEVNKEGAFSVSVHLSPGRNLYTLVFEDASKGDRSEKVLSWDLDQTPPMFQLENLRPDQSMILTEDAGQVVGHFMLPGEKGPIAIEEGVEVFAGKVPLKISADRRSFSGRVLLPDGDHELLIVAKDLAGNSYERVLKIHASNEPFEVNLSPDISMVNKKGMGAMLLFKGKTVPGAILMFGNRPVKVEDDGTFSFEIYPHTLKDMYDLGYTKISAQDGFGRRREIDIPRKGDFEPPYWVLLRVSAHSNGKVSLTGKTSKPDVRVTIGAIEGISDQDGNIRLDNVPVKKDQQLISTILKDSSGNESHVEQWMQPNSAGSEKRSS